VKQLEQLIDGIKSNGFDKMKSEVEKRSKIKQELEKNIERLKNSVRINNDHTINCETTSTKLQIQNNLIFTSGGRAHKELYFVNKEIPVIKNEIDEVYIT
jgi:LPS O-antigen subunit length determinant protein (WzzB/FepE family)